MAKSELIQVRVTKELKEESCKLFSKLGIDTATAVRMFLAQSIKCNGLPFSLSISESEQSANHSEEI